MAPITIDGTTVTDITVDGDPIGRVTVDGDVVWSADQSRLIASFEPPEFDDAWGGRKDTINGDLETAGDHSIDGQYSLFHATGDGYDATTSYPGEEDADLPLYPGVPSKQRYYVRASDFSGMDATWYFCQRNSGNDGLSVRLWGSNNRVFFYEIVDGNLQSIARDNSPSYPTGGEWLEITITVNGPDGTTFSGLQALEPQVEVYTINSDLSRNTEVSTCRGDDGQGDPIAISSSNALAEDQGGVKWTFNDKGSDVWADYHHDITDV